MREYVSTISKSGQATIPANERWLLGIKPGEAVAFRVEEGTVRLMRVEITFEGTFGSVKPIGPSLDVLEACRLANEEKVSRSLAELDEQSR